MTQTGPRLRLGPVRAGRRWVVLVVAVLLAGLLAGCDENLNSAAWVRNQTGQAIDVYEVVDGQEQLLVSLDKPLGGSFDQELFGVTGRRRDGCSRGDLVARTKDGLEVARLTETLCINQGWQIDSDGSSHLME